MCRFWPSWKFELSRNVIDGNWRSVQIFLKIKILSIVAHRICGFRIILNKRTKSSPPNHPSIYIRERVLWFFFSGTPSKILSAGTGATTTVYLDVGESPAEDVGWRMCRTEVPVGPFAIGQWADRKPENALRTLFSPFSRVALYSRSVLSRTSQHIYTCSNIYMYVRVCIRGGAVNI